MLILVILLLIRLPGVVCDYFSEAMSITKRYFTSLCSIRSYASLIWWIEIISMSQVIAWSAQKSSMIDHDAFRIAAVSHAAGVLVFAVVYENDAAIAELLEVRPAIFASAAGINHAAHADQIALAKFLHVGSNLPDAPDDLVTRNAGVSRAAPLVPHCMQIRVAHAAKQNIDLDVIRRRLAAVEGKWREW
jgi:hypothetical protein